MLCVAASSFQIRAGNEKDEMVNSMRIEYRTNAKEYYAHQPFAIVVTLVSPTSDIVYANEIVTPTLKSGEFDTFQNVDHPGDAYVELQDGKKQYCYPLKAYVVTMGEKGKYTISSGEYEIGTTEIKIINDPFWGKRRYRDTVSHQLKAEAKDIKIKALPKVPEGVDFSGSVGDFTLETIIPPGDIYVGEEGLAVILLRGKGMIAESVLPEYRKAFSGNIKLKSISESRKEVYDKGELISEIRLECTFIPTEKENVEIGEAIFHSFNPYRGEYETVKSLPVKVKVKSTTSRLKSIEI